MYGVKAFAGCEKLKTVNFAGTQEQWREKVTVADDTFAAGTTIICTDGTI